MANNHDPVSVESLSRRQAGICLLFIAVAACASRLAQLDFQSYWYDELFSAHFSNPAHSLSTVVELTVADVHPPLFQVLMWLSYQACGYTEWAGRLPSAMAGIIAIAAIFLLGRELFGRTVGVYAALFATLNFYLLYYAQEARSFALLYCLSTVSFLFFVRVLHGHSGWNVAAYVVATLMLLYTHYFGFLMLVVQALCMIVFVVAQGSLNQRLKAHAAVAGGLLLLGVLPLLPVVLGHAAIDQFWIWQPPPNFIVSYFAGYFASPVLVIFIFLLILIAVIGSAFRRPWQQQQIGVLMLLIWVVVGYALPWLRGEFGLPVLTDRNTIMLVPAVLLLAAVGLSLLPWRAVQRALIIAFVLYGSYFLLLDRQYYSSPVKQDYRGMTAALTGFHSALPVYALKDNDNKFNVYFEQTGSELRAQDISQLEAALAAGSAPTLFWLVDGHLRSLQTDLPERHRLIEVGRLRYYGTFANLYVNPAVARRLDTRLADPVDAASGRQTRVLMSQQAWQADGRDWLLISAEVPAGETAGSAVVVSLERAGEADQPVTRASDTLPWLIPVSGWSAGDRVSIGMPEDEVQLEVWHFCE